MHKCFLHILSFFLFLAISGCVANPYFENIKPVSLLNKSKPLLKSTRIIVGLDPNNTNNFISEHHGSSGQQNGLLGGLIESIFTRAINKDKQNQARLMAPIQNATINFNFGSEYRAELEKSIRQTSPLKITSVSKTPNFQRFNAKSILQETNDDAVLVSDVFYKMESDFSKMTFTSFVLIYPNTTILKNLAKKTMPEEEYPVLFRDKFIYIYNFEKDYQDSTKAAKEWASDNGAMVQRALKKGVMQLSKAIAKAL